MPHAQNQFFVAVLTEESWDIPDFYDKSRVEESLHTIG